MNIYLGYKYIPEPPNNGLTNKILLLHFSCNCWRWGSKDFEKVTQTFEEICGAFIGSQVSLTHAFISPGDNKCCLPLPLPNNAHSIVPFRWNNTIIWISVWIKYSRVSIHNIWIYLRKISLQCNYWNNLRLGLGEFELFLWGYFSPKTPVTVGTEQAHKLLTLNKGSQFSKRAV